MVVNTIIKNPSPQIVRLFDSLQEKKQRQIKKLTDMKRATVTIKV